MAAKLGWQVYECGLSAMITLMHAYSRFVQRIFQPATALMNRLTYPGKFLVLGGLSLLAVGVLVYHLYLSLDRVMDAARAELAGIPLISLVSHTVQSVQQHRGLQAGALAGEGMLRAEADEKQRQVSRMMASLQTDLPFELRDDAAFILLSSEWYAISKEGASWSVERSFQAHTDLIRHLLDFQVAIADHYALTLDPDINIHYLVESTLNRLPQTAEHMGQLRAHGTAILSAGQATLRQRIELGGLLRWLDNELATLSHDLEKTGRYNPSIRQPLLLANQDVAKSVRQVLDAVQAEITQEPYQRSPHDFFDAVTVSIDQIYRQIYGGLLPAMQTLLNQRLERTRHTLWFSVGAVGLLFLGLLYFVLAGYLAVTGSIRKLAEAARDFAAGHTSIRIEMENRDELSQVAHSFNQMAEGFNRLLQIQQEQQERLHAIVDTALDAVVQIDEGGLIKGWNRQAERIFGWAQREALGRQMQELIVPPRFREAHRAGMQHFLHTGDGAVLNRRIEIVALHRNGHEFPIELAITPNKHHGRYEFSAFIRDITEKKHSEELIWNQANFDALTALPNRRMFGDRLEQELKKSHRAALPLALLFIDLDHFKEVNDSLGHEAGDLLLIESARRIVSCVRESDTVARLGGDEFTVILSEVEDVNSVERVAQTIIQRLHAPFQLGDETAYVSASIGITLYPADAKEVNGLIKNADQAMYVAKNTGRNRFCYFTKSMQRASRARQRLIHDLRTALERDQFVVHYQPIVELKSGRIVKAEALLRWRHPVLGMVPPTEFIQLAEDAGLMHAIGSWVFQQVLRKLKRWNEINATAFQVSINKSPSQFQSGALHGDWVQSMSTLGVPGNSLVVEISEGMLLDPEHDAVPLLLKLRDSGIQVAIDDFGIGYSALSYLKTLSIDFIKIDRSFVSSLAHDSQTMALLEAIIVMAHKLGIQVVAKGVESAEQRDLLLAMGCDYAQGYLFSQPLPAEAFESLLQGQQEGRGTRPTAET